MGETFGSAEPVVVGEIFSAVTFGSAEPVVVGEIFLRRHLRQRGARRRGRDLLRRHLRCLDLGCRRDAAGQAATPGWPPASAPGPGLESSRMADSPRPTDPCLLTLVGAAFCASTLAGSTFAGSILAGSTLQPRRGVAFCASALAGSALWTTGSCFTGRCDVRRVAARGDACTPSRGAARRSSSSPWPAGPRGSRLFLRRSRFPSIPPPTHASGTFPVAATTCLSAGERCGALGSRVRAVGEGNASRPRRLPRASEHAVRAAREQHKGERRSRVMRPRRSGARGARSATASRGTRSGR